MIATTVGPHIFWITSRAAGTAALLLSSAAVCMGLLMGGRYARRRGYDLRVTHEALSLATMIAIAVHGVSLLGDHFLHPTLLDITVPFAGGYKTFWTSAGIVAGWSLIVLGLSYYVRDKIGTQRWRKMHRFTALAWILGLMHTLGEGTDTGTRWFLVLMAIAVLPPLFLLGVRTLAGPRPPRAGERAA